MGVTPGIPRQGGLTNEDVQSAITAALASYTPTSSLAAVATSGSASDLVTGTLANARLSPQVVRSDFSYSDPAWITAISATKLTGFVDDARLSGNVALKNGSNVFTAGNTFQASQVFDASIVVGGVTGPRIRAVSGVFRLNNNADSARAGLEISDLTATGNGSITGTLQIGGASGHLLRWNAGASSLEVRDSANAYYRKARVGELQVVADLGGSNATPANARIGLLTQIGGYIAGSISGRTYSANAAHGDVIVSASQNMTTGQNDYSSQTDDLVVRGLTGNVEINRGLLGIGMAGQSARSISILPQNTGDRTGVRVYDYGTYATSASQSGFEVAYLGGLPSVPSSTVAGHSRNLLSFRTGGSTGALSTVPSFAIRSTIGAIIGSALSEVNTSLLVTPTSTGVPLAAITIMGQSGLVDFPVGQIQLGTNVRLKNSSGDLQIRNNGDSDFAGLFAGAANFSNVVSASNGIKVSGSAGIQHSSVTPVATSGSIAWMDYTGNSNLLYRRDVVNGRMHTTYTQGATAALALTQFHSGVTVDGVLNIGGSTTSYLNPLGPTGASQSIQIGNPGPIDGARGIQSTAIGTFARASAYGSSAFGVAAKADGADSLVFGRDAVASHARAVLFGFSATSTRTEQIVFAANGGSGTAPQIRICGQSSNTVSRTLGLLTASWLDPTDGSRRAQLIESISDASGDRNVRRIYSDGSRGYMALTLHTTGPLDSSLQNGEAVFFDDGTGSISVKVKDSGGAVRTETLTSAFQTLSFDPSTLDISSGAHRLVKNTTSGEIRNWVNDGGVMKKSPAYA